MSKCAVSRIANSKRSYCTLFRPKYCASAETADSSSTTAVAMDRFSNGSSPADPPVTEPANADALRGLAATTVVVEFGPSLRSRVAGNSAEVLDSIAACVGLSNLRRYCRARFSSAVGQCGDEVRSHARHRFRTGDRNHARRTLATIAGASSERGLTGGAQFGRRFDAA